MYLPDLSDPSSLVYLSISLSILFFLPILFVFVFYSIIFYFILTDLTLPMLPSHVLSDRILPCLSSLPIYTHVLLSFFHQSISQSVSQSVNQSINQSINQLINQSVVYTSMTSFWYHRCLLVCSIAATCCNLAIMIDYRTVGLL